MLRIISRSMEWWMTESTFLKYLEWLRGKSVVVVVS
jgi:hypothetical protein